MAILQSVLQQSRNLRSQKFYNTRQRTAITNVISPGKSITDSLQVVTFSYINIVQSKIKILTNADTALPWSSFVEGDEVLYLPNCQTNLVIALHAPSLLFWHFINTTAYHLGRYEPSSPVSCCAPYSYKEYILYKPRSCFILSHCRQMTQMASTNF